MHILMINGEPSLRRDLLARLIAAGHSVEEAENPEAARALLASGDFDIVLCDLEVPGGDWLALLRESRRAGVDAGFVIVTASGSVDTAIEALRAGASDYVTKPASGDELLHRLDQFAALRRLREQNRALRHAIGKGDGSGEANGEPCPLRMQLRRHESEIIVRALEQADGDRRIAARRLGIGLSSLYRKIDELEIRDRVRASS